MATSTKGKMELSKKSFMFCVHCERTKWGENVAVVGSFCDWDPARALQMHTTEQIWPIWMSEPITLNPAKDQVEYKYIIVHGAASKLTWERRRNRQLHAGKVQPHAFAGILNLAFAITPRIDSARRSESQTCFVMDDHFDHIVTTELTTAQLRQSQIAVKGESHQSSQEGWAGDADAGAGGSSGQSGSDVEGSVTQDSVPAAESSDFPSFSPCRKDTTPHEWNSPASLNSSGSAWANITPRSWNSPTPRSWTRPVSARKMIPRLPRLPSLGLLGDSPPRHGPQDKLVTISKITSPPSSDSESSSDAESKAQFDVPIRSARDTSIMSARDISMISARDISMMSARDISILSARCDWEGDFTEEQAWEKWNGQAWDYPLSRKDKQNRLLNLFLKNEEATRENEIASNRKIRKLTRNIQRLDLVNQRLTQEVQTARSTHSLSILTDPQYSTRTQHFVQSARSAVIAGTTPIAA